MYRLNIKIEYFNIICSVKSLSFIHPALHFARWEAKFSDTRVNSLVLNGYYKRKLAVTSAVVLLLCRLISLFLNFIFYSSVNNAQSWRRNVGGSYKYYTWVVFRSSHFGINFIFPFFLLSKMWNKTIIWSKTVMFSFFRQEGFHAEFGWNFYRKLSKSIFAFTKAFSLCRQQVIWSFTHNEKFLFTHGSSESLCLQFFSSVMN